MIVCLSFVVCDVSRVSCLMSGRQSDCKINSIFPYSAAV